MTVQVFCIRCTFEDDATKLCYIIISQQKFIFIVTARNFCCCEHDV